MTRPSRVDKVRGAFLGIAIGDALGMPLETMTAETIKQRFGFVTEYLEPKGHKWFDGRRAGTWTDDTQLSLAVAESLIACRGLDLDDMAERHVEALAEDDKGWGNSTRNAIQRIADEVHWSKSGKSDNPGDGLGNGVAMKVAPLGLITHLDSLTEDGLRKICQLAWMTHYTLMASSSAFAQIEALNMCFTNSGTLPRETFAFSTWSSASAGYKISESTIEPTKEKVGSDVLHDRLEYLFFHDLSRATEEIIEMFDEGTCYVYNSLPFSYAFFMRNMHSIETLYDVINAGGDTDTNGSIVGALLGALNGASIFPQHLIDGLDQKDKILDTADRFCEAFEIE